MNQQRFNEGPDDNLWFAENGKIGKSRKTAFLVLGVVLAAILLSGGVAGADADKLPDNPGSGKDSKGDIALASSATLDAQPQTQSTEPLEFKPREDSPVGAGPFSIEAGEYNGTRYRINTNTLDGTLTLAKTGEPDQTINISSAQFDVFDVVVTEPSDTTDPNKPIDFNGNGLPDSANTNFDSGNISIVLDIVGGTVSRAPDVPVEGGNPLGLGKPVDYDGDEILDLAVGDNNGGATVFKGNGDGTFGDPVRYSMGEWDTETISTDDFDGDGYPDLTGGSGGGPFGGNARFLLNDGQGNFQQSTNIDTDDPVSHVVGADGDGDGDKDLYMVLPGSNQIRVQSNNGDGTFEEKPPFQFENNEAPQRMATFVKDGETYFVTSNSRNLTVGKFMEAGVLTRIQDLETEGNLTDVDAVTNDQALVEIYTTDAIYNIVSKFEEEAPSSAACSDGKDNDGDGKIDLDDPGCESPEDDDEVGTPELSVSDVRVTEGNSSTTDAVFTVTRSGDTGGASSVAFDTENGTATAPGDYEETSGSLIFASGEASKEIRVPVKGDTQDEPDEDFFVNLTDPTGATISDEQGKGKISDDDAPLNTPPNANSDSYTIKGKTLRGNVLNNDSDSDGDRLTATLVSDPSKGKVALTTTGSFTYTPSKAFKKGTDSFTYRASDGKGGTDQATVTLRKAKKKK